MKLDADADAAATSAGCSIGIRPAATRNAPRGSTAGGAIAARQFDEAVRVFELAASTIPRANTRPAWLYWAGRSREQRKDVGGATQVLTLAAVDYFHSYYGRIASEALTRLGAPVPATAPRLAPASCSPRWTAGTAMRLPTTCRTPAQAMRRWWRPSRRRVRT